MGKLLGPYFYIILSALLIGLSTTLSYAIVKWVAFIPFLFVLSNNKYSLRKKIFYSWVLGFLVLLFQFSFILDIHPLSWIGIYNVPFSFILVVIGWVLFSFALSIPSFFVGFSHFSLYLFPLFWVLSEYVRSWTYSIFMLGESSILGDVFSLGLFGHSVHSSGLLLALAPYLGLYGLGFLMVLINALLFKSVQYYLHWPSQSKNIVLGVVLILILVVEFLPLSILGQESTSAKTLRIASIQGVGSPAIFSYTNETFESITKYYDTVVQKVFAEHPEVDIIVMPEFTRYIEYKAERDKRNAKEVAQETLGGGSYKVLVYGNYDYGQQVSMTTAVSNNPNEEFQHVEKRYLMPVGEYQPFVLEFLAKIFGAKEWFRELSYNRTTYIGNTHTKRLLETEVARISPVTCSEILSYKVYKDIEALDPDIITHHQRLAPFHGNKKVFHHTLVISKFQAARLKKHIIGSVDGSGYSYMINPYGKIISIGDPKTAYIYQEISL